MEGGRDGDGEGTGVGDAEMPQSTITFVSLEATVTSRATSRAQASPDQPGSHTQEPSAPHAPCGAHSLSRRHDVERARRATKARIEAEEGIASLAKTGSMGSQFGGGSKTPTTRSFCVVALIAAHLNGRMSKGGQVEAAEQGAGLPPHCFFLERKQTKLGPVRTAAPAGSNTLEADNIAFILGEQRHGPARISC